MAVDNDSNNGASLHDEPQPTEPAREIGPVDICRAKHPTSWWITCQLEMDHFGEHVRHCPPVETGERLRFSQYTVHWQDPCECDSHTGVGEDLWKCDECGEVIRYIDDPEGNVTLTELHPHHRSRRVRVEMVTPGTRPGMIDGINVPQTHATITLRPVENSDGE